MKKLVSFKVLPLWGNLPRKTYPCDPEKNTACGRATCFIEGGICRRTLNKRFEQKNPK